MSSLHTIVFVVAGGNPYAFSESSTGGVASIVHAVCHEPSSWSPLSFSVIFYLGSWLQVLSKNTGGASEHVLLIPVMGLIS